MQWLPTQFTRIWFLTNVHLCMSKNDFCAKSGPHNSKWYGFLPLGIWFMWRKSTGFISILFIVSTFLVTHERPISVQKTQNHSHEYSYLLVWVHLWLSSITLHRRIASCQCVSVYAQGWFLCKIGPTHFTQIWLLNNVYPFMLK